MILKPWFLDIRSVDAAISNQLFQMIGLSYSPSFSDFILINFRLDVTLAMVIRLVWIILLSPVFVFPSVALAIVGGWTGQVYIAAQLSVKRRVSLTFTQLCSVANFLRSEMSNARSPLYSHFNAAIAGIISIRAYGAQRTFIDESMTRINKYTRSARTFHNLNR